MQGERLLSRDDIAFRLAGRRNLLVRRGEEMKRLLLEIVAQIDAGAYETDYTGYLLETVQKHKLSREENMNGIKELREQLKCG